MLTHHTKRQRKFELFNPSQASLSSPGKVQQCRLILRLHNTTSCTCAAEQQHRVAAGSAQHASQASHAVGKLSSISLACGSHNTANKNFEFDICHLPDHLLGHLPEHLLNPSQHPNQVTCQSTNLQPSIAYESLVLTENRSWNTPLYNLTKNMNTFTFFSG